MAVGDSAEAPPYSVRVLARDDVARMREALGCFAEVFADPQTYSDDQPDDAYLSELLGGECFVAVVAVDQGQVVGALAGYELRKFEQARSEFYIYDLAVREAYRRQGIATALIGAFEAVARSRNGWVVFVQADYGDDAAVALYSKLGVREDVMHFDIPLDRRDSDS